MKIGTYRWGCKATSIMGELPVKPIREILTLQMAIGRTAQQSIKQMADFESGPLLESRQSRMSWPTGNQTEPFSSIVQPAVPSHEILQQQLWPQIPEAHSFAVC